MSRSRRPRRPLAGPDLTVGSTIFELFVALWASQDLPPCNYDGTAWGAATPPMPPTRKGVGHVVICHIFVNPNLI